MHDVIIKIEHILYILYRYSHIGIYIGNKVVLRARFLLYLYTCIGSRPEKYNIIFKSYTYITRRYEVLLKHIPTVLFRLFFFFILFLIPRHYANYGAAISQEVRFIIGIRI